MNKEAANIFSRVILADRQIRIKLLGDSITHGVGGSGFEQNGEHITANFSRNPDGYCWANKFKTFIESRFNCTVTNNACTGTTIEFIIDNFDKLVNKEDDIIICTIGTNNRHQYFDQGPKHTKEEHMKLFYKNIIALHNKFKEAGKDVIFMANIPASAENEEDGENYWRLFHMNDVQDMYTKASFECGFPLIRLYSLFSKYCTNNKIQLDSLLADGLHPNDKGYDVMFDLIINELGFAV